MFAKLVYLKLTLKLVLFVLHIFYTGHLIDKVN